MNKNENARPIRKKDRSDQTFGEVLSGIVSVVSVPLARVKPSISSQSLEERSTVGSSA